MPSPLGSELAAKAVNALFKFEEKKQTDAGKQSLVGYYAKPILAQIQLKAAIKKAVVRPVRVKIPNSLFNADTEDHSVCLFCRSEDKEAIDDYLVESPIEGLTKVISINEVRKLFSAYKDRKKLLSEHTHFVCDANVMAQLYNLLGKTFADRNNSPIPVNYKSPEKLPAAILKACSASYIHLKGETITVRIGLTSMSEDDVTANAKQGLDFAVSKFKGAWSDVKCIHLKTSDSPALPIYAHTANEMLDFVEGKTVEAVVEVAAVTVKGKKGKAAATAAAAAVVVAAPVVAVLTKAEVVKATPSKKRERAVETEPVVEEEEPQSKVKKSAVKSAKKPTKKA